MTGSVDMLKIASEHFRQDIASHWAQANFFSVIQAAFISVFSTSVAPQDVGEVGLLSSRTTATVIATAGLVFAALWYIMAKGREKYIRLWRKQVVALDTKDVDQLQVYVAVEQVADDDFWNPTRIVIRVPVVVGVGWLVAIVWLQAERYLAGLLG